MYKLKIFLSRKTIVLFFGILISTGLSAQNTAEQKKAEKRWLFGGAFGGGSLIQKDEGQSAESYTKFSMLNLKVGYFIHPRTAVCLHIPSGGHKEKDETRAFEALLISGQHWFIDRFWGSAGLGLAMDMPSLFDTSNENPKFYFGPAASIGAGYELWRKGKFALDIQGRILYGNYKVEGKQRQSTAFDLMIGFAWYK